MSNINARGIQILWKGESLEVQLLFFELKDNRFTLTQEEKSIKYATKNASTSSSHIEVEFFFSSVFPKYVPSVLFPYIQDGVPLLFWPHISAIRVF